MGRASILNSNLKKFQTKLPIKCLSLFKILHKLLSLRLCNSELDSELKFIRSSTKIFSYVDICERMPS